MKQRISGETAKKWKPLNRIHTLYLERVFSASLSKHTDYNTLLTLQPSFPTYASRIKQSKTISPVSRSLNNLKAAP